MSKNFTVPVDDAVGMVLSHDITEIVQGQTKGPAFRKGHIIAQADIEHLKRLGKENIFVLNIGEDELHEDAAASMLSSALMGRGVAASNKPSEGKINIVAEIDGLLKIDKDALMAFNMTGEAACATRHTDTVVKKGDIVAATRAIPLIIAKDIVNKAVEAARSAQDGAVSVIPIKRPKAGVVITGNEVFYGRIKDAFAPIIEKKITEYGGSVVSIKFAPDDANEIKARLHELLDAGADLLITTGGMSVDPDDVTRFAIRELGVREMYYGTPVLPGSMFLLAYIGEIPILGIPACGMYHKTTVFDLILPRVLAGSRIDRSEIAALGHGGLCLNCKVCQWPVCPFGK